MAQTPQTLLLGLGGTGSSIVNNVAAELKKRRVIINDGKICCTVLDTNDNDREHIQKTGTGVTIIPTSKNRIIEEYMKMYSDRGVDSWMPSSAALKQQNMKDGAAQMRPKSRLAFFDILEDRTIIALEEEINKLFNNGDQTTVRIMIVSSLAGGTGSGMFIQVALWLRKFFSSRRCTATIRGIFLLPDVFIKTIQDIREDNTEIQSLYANAYGAIRELNAITKIKTKGVKPLFPVKIGDLFDSTDAQLDGNPVYDYAFFMDDISEGGKTLSTINQYERVAARLVYMQLYAPMRGSLYSEEDNLFKRFQKSPEPVFGSCGTAKAKYPVDDVIRYCALRAAQDSISNGWRKIDDEIKDKQRKEAEREAEGANITHRIDPRQTYVKLFKEKIQKTGKQVGRDRLFVGIANDVNNEKLIPGQDGIAEVASTDKLDDFVEELDKLIATTIDSTNPGNLRGIKLQKNWSQKTSDTKETLMSLVVKKEKDVVRFLDATDVALEDMADEVLGLVFPSDMGDATQDNPASILGFLTKKDKNQKPYFIHPLAVRYLLYRLASRLDEIKETSLTDVVRSSAEKGYGSGKPKISFDNSKTREVEDTPAAYLVSKSRFQNEGDFVKDFKSKYAQHNEGQFELCRTYAITALKQRFAIVLSERLETLIRITEEFFKNLVRVSNSLEDEIVKNIHDNEQETEKIFYICATRKEKEALYKSICFDTNSGDAKINAIIVNSFYGQFCAEESPEADNNKKYKGKSTVNLFFKEVISTYSKIIRKKNKEDIDLDIYSAICKSSDIDYEAKQREKNEENQDSDRLDVDLETSDDIEAVERYQRHIKAMKAVIEKLKEMSAPFLICSNEVPEDPDEHLIDNEKDDEEVIFTPTRKRKTFWGFHPILIEKCSELAAILGVDVEKQKNEAYEKNELDCYRAVYGIRAGHIFKFNETRKGEYYRNYRQVVREMIREVGKGETDALIHTPHIDKTWHLYLPYITPEKQLEEDNKFYRLFWLAIAYGMIYVGSDGYFYIVRTKKTVTGQYQKSEPAILNGKKIGKVKVLDLLTFLRFDGSFMIDAAKLEKKFAEECENANGHGYDTSEFMRGKSAYDESDNENADAESKSSRSTGRSSKSPTVGGLASKADCNAVTLIVRSYHSPKRDDDITMALIHALERLCRELVAGNYEQGEDAKITSKGFERCKRIYNASALKEKNIELFRHWKDAWNNKKIED